MIFFKLLKFELLQNLRRYNDLTTPLWFLLLVSCLFSLSLQHEPGLLQKAAPGIIWSGLLLAMLLSIHQLFAPDYQSGVLEQMILSPTSLVLIVWVKVIAYWLKTCLPLLACIPLLALQLQLSFEQTQLIFFSLLLATPSLVLLGALGAALTLRLQNNNLLLSLLILPLSFPFLIFGLGMTHQATLGLPITTPLFLLIALLILSIGLLPWIIAFSLRIGINQT
ncbi:MAG: heme exporter protein CcmB [Gammaproteobacteria bacterium]|nr:heme exporter protein CcmB [Gammaproteobacteria bacterium]